MIGDDYKNDLWWLEMKQRMEKKSKKQIELDRKLLEQIGSKWAVNGKESEPNLDEIKKLISLGAQPDHWVEQDMGRILDTGERYGLFNAIMSNAVFYRWASTLRHKYGSKISFRTSNVVLIL